MDSADAAVDGRAAISRALQKWGGDPQSNQSFWEYALPLLDRLDQRFGVLSEGQRNRLGELRQRIEFMTPRESAFVHGLLIQCIGVGAAEGEGDA